MCNIVAPAVTARILGRTVAHDSSRGSPSGSFAVVSLIAESLLCAVVIYHRVPGLRDRATSWAMMTSRLCCMMLCTTSSLLLLCMMAGT